KAIMPSNLVLFRNCASGRDQRSDKRIGSLSGAPPPHLRRPKRSPEEVKFHVVLCEQTHLNHQLARLVIAREWLDVGFIRPMYGDLSHSEGARCRRKSC